MEYHHRQFGTVIVASLAAATIFIALPLLRSEAFYAIQVEVLILLLAALVLFYSLTVEIIDNILICRMGIGLIQKRIPLSEIEQVRKVQIPLYAGWGIHGIPGQCWVWNVSGRSGVELTYKDGRRFLIGTDEPEVVVKAIEAAKTMGN